MRARVMVGGTWLLVGRMPAELAELQLIHAIGQLVEPLVDRPGTVIEPFRETLNRRRVVMQNARDPPNRPHQRSKTTQDNDRRSENGDYGPDLAGASGCNRRRSGGHGLDHTCQMPPRRTR